MGGVVLVVAGLVLALFAALYGVQRGMIFAGSSRAADPHAARRHPAFESAWVEIPGARVETWFAPATGSEDGQDRPVVIFAHGNGELIDDWPDMLAGFSELGLHLLLVEYPGYGRSTGQPSQSSVHDVMLAAYDAVVARPGVSADRVVLYGRSLGGGAVCSVLGERNVAALILQSTFESVTAIAWQSFRLPGFLVRDPFDNRSAVEDFEGPVLVIHGQQDRLIPHTHGVALHAVARDGRLVTYPCGHNDCPPSWPRFWRDVGSFLAEAGVTQ
jgi:fermentation-respiration switch protein FrsA (DUF1100 family)